MIHRRDGFRAHPATVAQVRELCAAGKMELRTFWELKGIHGDARVERVTIVNNKTKEEDTLAMDAVLPQLGFVSSLGAIAEWGLELEKHDIKVSQLMETSIPGIFAAGDITTYPGKLKLIATGAAEACVAVNHAVHFINPSAKVEPGHSSNMAIFGQAQESSAKSATGAQAASLCGPIRPCGPCRLFRLSDLHHHRIDLRQHGAV